MRNVALVIAGLCALVLTLGVYEVFKPTKLRTKIVTVDSVQRVRTHGAPTGSGYYLVGPEGSIVILPEDQVQYAYLQARQQPNRIRLRTYRCLEEYRGGDNKFGARLQVLVCEMRTVTKPPGKIAA